MTVVAAPTVLLVDDEEMVVTAIRSFLDLETPYRTLAYQSPLRALEALEHERVDVVIADFMMPEMDGVEFLKTARELRPLAPRILLTGYADLQSAILGINAAGLYHYLQKPWENAQLELVIQNAIERASLLTELVESVTALDHANDELSGIRRRLIQAFL